MNPPDFQGSSPTCVNTSANSQSAPDGSTCDHLLGRSWIRRGMGLTAVTRLSRLSQSITVPEVPISCVVANTGAVCKAAVPSHKYVLKLLSQQESVSVRIRGYTSDTCNCLYSANNVNGTLALSYFKSRM